MIWLIVFLAQRGRWFLEVVLHIGAHRTGTTSFQRALHQNQHNLIKSGVTVWDPRITRAGRFSGLLGPQKPETGKLLKRNLGVLMFEMDRLADIGQKTLLVSEENLMGSMRANLRQTRLYPGLEDRMARLAGVYGSVCQKIGLCIRPYEDYWASAMAYAIKAGHRVLDEDGLDRLVTQPRSWRNVVSDVAKAFPNAEVIVWEFDRFIGRPNAQYRLLAGNIGRLQPMAERFNASPDKSVLREVLSLRGDQTGIAEIGLENGRYAPFGAHHLVAFQAQYQEDLDWLRGRPRAEFDFIEQAPMPDAPVHRLAGGGLS